MRPRSGLDSATGEAGPGPIGPLYWVPGLIPAASNRAALAAAALAAIASSIS